MKSSVCTTGSSSRCSTAPSASKPSSSHWPALGDKVRLFVKIGQALLAARQAGHDPFAAIEAIVPWDVFAAGVTEAGQLARPAERFDFLDPLSTSCTATPVYAGVAGNPAAQGGASGAGVAHGDGDAQNVEREPGP